MQRTPQPARRLSASQWYKDKYNNDANFRERELQRSRAKVEANKDRYKELWAAAYQRRKQRALAAQQPSTLGCFTASRVGPIIPPLDVSTVPSHG